MKRIVTAVDGAVFLPADANTWQDYSQGFRAGDLNNNLAEADVRGVDAIVWQGTVPTASVIVILDASMDWRDRIVWGWARYSDVSTWRVGQSNDYELNNFTGDLASGTTGDPQARPIYGYTGTGAVSNLATGAAVTGAAPPLNGAGVFRSYALHLGQPAGFTGDSYLYVDASSHKLCAFNGELFDTYLQLVLYATDDTGLR
jgi:hypothetical protein